MALGAGKTMLVEKLTKHLNTDYEIAAITNDIYTKEDAKILLKTGVLSEDRIIGVETGVPAYSNSRGRFYEF